MKNKSNIPTEDKKTDCFDKNSINIIGFFITIILIPLLGLIYYNQNEKIKTLESTTNTQIGNLNNLIKETESRNQISLKNQYDMLIQLINAISSNKKISLNLYKKDAQWISKHTGLNVYYPNGKPLEKFSEKDNEYMHADVKFNFSIIKTEKASFNK